MAQNEIDLEKIYFSVESVDSVQEEITPLLVKHWEELEWKKSKPINPDWNHYKEIEDKGGLVIFVAKEDKELIGYNVFFLNESLHYMGSTIAVQDLIYIKPEKRGFGKYFINWCNEELKELGFKTVFYNTKADKDFGEKILIPMGFELVDMVYGKEL